MRRKFVRVKINGFKLPKGHTTATDSAHYILGFLSIPKRHENVYSASFNFTPLPPTPNPWGLGSLKWCRVNSKNHRREKLRDGKVEGASVEIVVESVLATEERKAQGEKLGGRGGGGVGWLGF